MFSCVISFFNPPNWILSLMSTFSQIHYMMASFWNATSYYQVWSKGTQIFHVYAFFENILMSLSPTVNGVQVSWLYSELDSTWYKMWWTSWIIRVALVSWPLERWDSNGLEPCYVESGNCWSRAKARTCTHVFLKVHSDSVDEVILGMLDMNEPITECWRMYHLFYPHAWVYGNEFKDWGMSII